MHNENNNRREFIKVSSLGIGSLMLPSHDAKHSSSSPKKIICLGAHPGDPEFGCGGTMARLAKEGHQVAFLYITRGEASDATKTYSEMAAIRTKEAEISSALIKARALFARQTDGNTVLSKKTNEDLSLILDNEKPDLLFTQWPVDAHPDHQVTGMLGLSYWVSKGRSFELYFYEVNTGSETMSFTPTDYVDITLWREIKKQAMFAHKSQDPVNTYNDFFKPLETFRGLEAGVQAAEAFIHFKSAGSRAAISI